MIRYVAVVVPARNEQSLLPRCLRSIAAARAQLPEHVSSDVIVVADCCTDGTQALASSALGLSGAVVRCHAGIVGAARALGVRTALQRFQGSAEHCWIANTDADCEVPPTWLVDQLSLAQRGFSAAAGIVSVDCFAEHKPHVPERFRLTYLTHADGSHPHVHGANLGVRGDAYLLAGGWANLATAEDHDLWKRLRALGQSCVSDSALRVSTSGRRIGRAPAGFAAALAAHNETAA